MPATLTVIMPTYNSGRHLRACLESFKAQTLSSWELICVDRGSTDDTRPILDEYARAWPQMRVLETGDERTSQFNAGVRASTSDFIYYTASDFYVDPNLLEDAVKVAVNGPADCVWINCISYGDAFWARVRNLERCNYFGSEKFEGARFFRRSLYEKVGGYDDAVPIFEEFDLQDRMRAAGATFGRVTTAAEYHLDEPQTLGEIWRRSFYIGTRYRDLLAKQGARALRHTNPVRSTFFKDSGRFVRHPRLTLGFVLLLLAKYGGGAAGVVASGFTKGRSHRARYGAKPAD